MYLNCDCNSHNIYSHQSMIHENPIRRLLPFQDIEFQLNDDLNPATEVNSRTDWMHKQQIKKKV